MRRLFAAGLLLAASLDGRPITDVFTWLTDPDNREMVSVLRRGGYGLIADDVQIGRGAVEQDRLFGRKQIGALCFDQGFSALCSRLGAAAGIERLDDAEVDAALC